MAPMLSQRGQARAPHGVADGLAFCTALDGLRRSGRDID
jgi:hypothetical protein